MAKRGRKKGENRKGYFYEEQENAFVKYLQSDNDSEKEYLFNNVLSTAFTKMVESIIRRYNLYVPDEDFDSTFHDTMSYMMTRVEKFDPNRGFKAYSYCGTICKNYLIHRVNKTKKVRDSSESYDLIKADIDDDIRLSYDSSDEGLNIEELMSGMSEQIKVMLSNPEKYKLNENEKKIGDVLVNLFVNWQDIFISNGSYKFTKSSILFFIKEMTLLNTKDIRTSLRKYKKAYFQLKKKSL